MPTDLKGQNQFDLKTDSLDVRKGVEEEGWEGGRERKKAKTLVFPEKKSYSLLNSYPNLREERE